MLDPRRSAITENPHPDWDPHAQAVLDDQLAEYDGMRARCRVARSDYLGWSLFRHDDVCQVLADHETFSNAVSARLTVPNGMDPPEHTEYRRINDPYFAPGLMDAFEPPCREAEIHPLLADRIGVADGDLVQVTSARGMAVAVAHVTESTRPDSVFMPFHWSGTGSANRVTSDATDPMSGMPEFKVCAVDVQAAAR